MKDIKQRWIQCWEENGEPDISSNKYLALLKSFYFTEGYEQGVRAVLEMSKEDNV